MHGFLGVDQDVLMVFGVVGCACGDAQHVLRVVRYLRHICGFWCGFGECWTIKSLCAQGFLGMVLEGGRFLSHILLPTMTSAGSWTRVLGR